MTTKNHPERHIVWRNEYENEEIGISVFRGGCEVKTFKFLHFTKAIILLFCKIVKIYI